MLLSFILGRNVCSKEVNKRSFINFEVKSNGLWLLIKKTNHPRLLKGTDHLGMQQGREVAVAWDVSDRSAGRVQRGQPLWELWVWQKVDFSPACCSSKLAESFVTPREYCQLHCTWRIFQLKRKPHHLDQWRTSQPETL